MKTETTRIVEIKVTTWKCDFCDYSTEENRGCCGVAPVMTCNMCGKHICHKHRHFYQEDWSSDYHDAVVCDDCEVTFNRAWNWALDNAGRYDSMFSTAEERFLDIINGNVEEDED